MVGATGIEPVTPPV